MNRYWELDDTVILINPSYSKQQQALIRKQLGSVSLKGHFWLSTSGTTAKSSSEIKWAAVSKQAILFSASAVNSWLESDSTDTWLLALPSFHIGGLGILARSYLSQAAIVDYKKHCGGKWNPELFHQLAHDHQVTLTALVPTQIYDLVNLKLRAPSSLRATVVGGGALAEDLYFRARELGWCPLPSYGLTECSSQVATASVESLKGDSYPSLQVLSHVKVSVSDEGKLILSSPSLFTTYAHVTPEGPVLNNPKVAGKFQTEDIVEIIDNTLVVSGRTKDFVKIGGESVNLCRLRMLLENLRSEKTLSGDQAIVAVENPRLGHSISLYSTACEQDAVQLLADAFNERVLPFEKIRTIEYVSEIPRTALGKLLN